MKPPASAARVTAPARLRPVRGFTLIELLTVMVVLAVLMRLAAPSFSSAFLSNRLASYANSFTSSVALARSEALKRGSTVTLCRSSDGATCAGSGGWQQGWIVLAGSTVVQYQQALEQSYSMTSSVYSLTFQPGGVGATTTTVTLCRRLPTPGGQERLLQVMSTGRVTVTTTKTGSCS